MYKHIYTYSMHTFEVVYRKRHTMGFSNTTATTNNNNFIMPPQDQKAQQQQGNSYNSENVNLFIWKKQIYLTT